MTLRQKLMLYALAVALLPLAASGFTLVALGERGMRARIEAHQRTAASAVATSIHQSVQELGERAVTALSLADPERLSPKERLGLLRLLHRQSPAIRTSVLLDAKGELLVRPLVFAEAERELEADLATQSVTRLRANLPTPATVAGIAGQALISAPYYPAEGPARVALAVPCGRGAAGRPLALAGLELVLDRSVLRGVGIDTGERARVFVVDSFGRVIAHPHLAVGKDLSAHAAVAGLLKGGAEGNARAVAEDGVFTSAFARVPAFGWAVVVEQPEAIAFADAARMKRRTLLWLFGTTLVVAATALWFAGRLRRRLQDLMQGAHKLSEGALDARIRAASADEIGELGRVLNQMAKKLERSFAELDAWSRTLEDKVDERTRELRETQAQLLLQSKLAAIGQLGAGVAHEVNNPLAGILGYVQLMLRKRAPDDPEITALRRIEEAAQRCKVVTTNLLRFSQRGLGGQSTTEVNEVAGEVIELMSGGFADAGMTIVSRLAKDAGAITADAGQIALVLINLMTNAKNAMTEGGRLEIATEDHGERVHIVVRDDGHGIEPEHMPRLFDPFFTTKENWSGVGLGLSVAYRIVTDHGGRIEVVSELGEGSTFTVDLPRKATTPPPESARQKRPVLLA